MARQIGIQGGAELAQAIKEFGAKFEVNVMRASMNAGAKVIATVAKGRAIGLDMNYAAKLRLVHAIRHRRGRSRNGQVVAGVFVASVPMGEKTGNKDTTGSSTEVRNDPAVWWSWVEYGTDERWTGSRGGKGRFRRRRRINTSPRVSRGRMKEQPFMRPAFDASSDAAIAEVAAHARKGVEREVRRIVKAMPKIGPVLQGGRFKSKGGPKIGPVLPTGKFRSGGKR